MSPAAAEPTTQIIADTCAVCHGTDGRSPGSIEHLAGMSSREFVEEMRELDEEPAEGRIMQPIGHALSEQQIRDLATYFAALPAPERSAHGDERRRSGHHENEEEHERHERGED